MKPFLKWAGGKYKLTPQINSLLPDGTRLVEPFVGSGSVFLNSNFDSFYLTDVNPDLIHLYQTLQKEGEAFIRYTESFFTGENNTEDAFYQLRELFNTTEDVRLKSALFVYLNRHAFNGLCRYNSKGKYNVPFGRYKKPYFPYEEMKNFYHKSKKAIFQCCDFKTTYSNLREGDVVYADPPYDPISETSSFTSYSTGGFSAQEQIELSDCAKRATNSGIPSLLSNHDTSLTRELYEGALCEYIDVQRNISAKGESRKQVREVLALFR